LAASLLQHLQNLFVLSEHLLKLFQPLIIHIGGDLKAVRRQQDANFGTGLFRWLVAGYEIGSGLI
jgi:hypothetical protein